MKIALVFLVATIAGVYCVKYRIPLGGNGSVSIAGNPDDVSGRRSIGGTPADPREHPYLAALVIYAMGTISLRAYCTAVLVRPNRLLTAAHCSTNADWTAVGYTAVLGSQHVYNGGTRIEVSNVIRHPLYTYIPITYNDIAVVILPVNVDARFTPIALPSPSMLRESFAGMPATLVGYGQTFNGPPDESYDPYCSQITVPIITNDQCRFSIGADIIEEGNICIEGVMGVGGCFGDSGGPLYVTINGVKTLIGIDSFIGSPLCAMGQPSVFARVTTYYDWFMPLLS